MVWCIGQFYVHCVKYNWFITLINVSSLNIGFVLMFLYYTCKFCNVSLKKNLKKKNTGRNDYMITIFVLQVFVIVHTLNLLRSTSCFAFYLKLNFSCKFLNSVLVFKRNEKREFYFVTWSTKSYWINFVRIYKITFITPLVKYT